MWLIITVLLFTTYCASAKVDYCSGYLFNSSVNSDYLQFTKELSSFEYSVVNSFKSLHCCAKGYRSIQWFKDGKPYPWATDVSTFILYPESANQTIYAQSLATIDAGNYTCVVADNAAQSLVHNVNLNVFDMSGYSDDPLSTYELPSQHFLRIGETARLFCEAFIGKMDMPDAVNEITWSRPGMNTTVLLSNRRVFKKDIFREGDQILGSYFIIRKVRRSDFGEYTCSVRNSGDQVIYMKTFLNELDWPSDKRNFSVPWLKVTVLVTVVVVCAVSMATICQHLILSVLLFLRNICWKRHDDGGKLFDILICYTSSDADFIKTTLGVTLQKKYGYKVVYKQLIDPSLAMIASQCSSILLIGSPGMCNDDMWSPKNIYNLLKYITSISNQVVFIPAKPLPNDESLKSEDGEKLRQILKNVCVVNFRSNKQSDVRLFWIKLRLALPSLKRNNSCISSSSSPSSSTSFLNEGFDLNHMNVTESMNTKISLVLTKSTDSIEVLV